MVDQRRRSTAAALGFAVAALLASWNPLSAPFGLAVGLASLLLSIRALQRGEGRRAAVALTLSAVAVVASAVALAAAAGVGREARGAPVVAVPGRAEVEEQLDSARRETRTARDRARAELEELDRSKGDGPAPGRSGTQETP